MPINPGDFFTITDAMKSELAKIPDIAAAEALFFFKDNFRLEGFQGDNGLEKWDKRKDTSINRPVLTGTGPDGRLRNSLYKLASKDVIWVGVGGKATKYADIHNFGGIIKVPVTAQMKKWGWHMYHKTGSAKYRAIALQPVGKIMTIKMPKRQFIGDSGALNKKLIDLAEKKMAEIAK